MSDERTVECPSCEGVGELGECVNDGTHGCSHTNDREWQCPLCRGYGAVTRQQADEYLADVAAEAAAAELLAAFLTAHPRRRVETVPGVDAWGPPPF